MTEDPSPEKLRKNLFPDPLKLKIDWDAVDNDENYAVFLADEIADESCRAAEILGEIGDKSAVKPLIRLLNGEMEGHIYRVMSVNEIDDEYDEFVMVEGTIMTAADALGKIGDKRAIEPLIKVLDSSDDWIHDAAKEALEKLGHTIDDSDNLAEPSKEEVEAEKQRTEKAILDGLKDFQNRDWNDIQYGYILKGAWKDSKLSKELKNFISKLESGEIPITGTVAMDFCVKFFDDYDQWVESMTEEERLTQGKEAKRKNALYKDSVPYHGKVWVSATKTRNFMNHDPMLDWLELYGDKLGFLRDTADEKYDAKLDFVQLLFRKGKEFEKIVIDHLKEKFGAEHFVTVAKNHEDSRDTAKQEETLQHMQAGVPFILQGVLRNSVNKTYGMPDIMVKSDYLPKIIDKDYTESHVPYKIQEVYLIHDDGRILSESKVGSGQYISFNGELKKVHEAASEALKRWLTAIEEERLEAAAPPDIDYQDSDLEEPVVQVGNLGSIVCGENLIILERGNNVILASLVYMSAYSNMGYRSLTNSIKSEAVHDIKSRMSRVLTKIEEEFELNDDVRSLSETVVHLEAIMSISKSVTKEMVDELHLKSFLSKIIPEFRDIDKSAEKLGNYHYRIIDVKFTTLTYNADGQYLLGADAYKSQLAIYNLALAQLQGFKPPEAYLIGRNWGKTKNRIKFIGIGALDRLGVVDFFNIDREFERKANDALEWIRRVRSEGSTWEVTPKPTVKELWPNCKNQSDYPWHNTKAKFADELNELTRVWQIGPKEREQAHNQGIYSWNDPDLTPEKIGIRGSKRAKILRGVLKINNQDKFKVLPPKISNNDRDWQKKPKLEFFVDFETVSNIDDDFDEFPKQGGQELIFMIGCGFERNRKFEIKVFTAKNLSVQEEARIISKWFEYMENIKNEILGPTAKLPNIFHWSPAELTFMGVAHDNLVGDEVGMLGNIYKERRVIENWKSLPWFDFLKVMKDEPIVLKGAFGFGLKAIAKKLEKHGLTTTKWEEGPADGLGAMVGAWHCDKISQEQGIDMDQTKIMQGIRKYNIIDCKVMWELVNYLRENHT